MRTARVVGLSQDGRTLIVATDSGEELAIPADDRLRAALRGDRPRLGQLEIEMDSALGPRDIQSRIRSGESLEEVARFAGMPLDRVERFAAPVLAEREHVARVAMASSVRRRGETSGHRTLRIILTERLVSRGVDIDTVAWDSFRMEDGRWSVVARYRSGEAEREAVFTFDLRARFSVAGNDEARWVLGEQSSVKGPQPGRRRPEGGEVSGPDAEPTLDLSDELALVRAISDPAPPSAVERPEPEPEPPSASVSRLRAVASDVEADLSYREDAPNSPAGPPAASSGVETADDSTDEITAEDVESEWEDLERGETSEFATEGHFEQSSLSWEEEHEESLEEEAAAEHSELHTLYGLLGSDGYAEDSIRVYSGLSDASAVPETDNAGWEPAIVVEYPVEPALQQEQPERPEGSGQPAPEKHGPEAGLSVTDASPGERPSPTTGRHQPAMPYEIPETTAYRSGTPEAPASSQRAGTGGDAPAGSEPVQVDASEGEPEQEAHPGAPKRAGKRKRASVPSWDEIMFGGPKPPS
jgi:hypothetical protein